ncbi:PaaI family thioesterase [Blastococcus sp. SYSU D01042]
MSADQPPTPPPFVAAMGFRTGEAGGTRVTGTAELGPDQHTPWGVVHGGVYCAIVETAASIGASKAVEGHGQFSVGVNNSTDFIRSMTAGTVDVVAEPVQQGRTQQLWQVTLTRAEDGKLVAQGRVRLQNVPLPGS